MLKNSRRRRRSWKKQKIPQLEQVPEGQETSFGGINARKSASLEQPTFESIDKPKSPGGGLSGTASLLSRLMANKTSRGIGGGGIGGGLSRGPGLGGSGGDGLLGTLGSSSLHTRSHTALTGGLGSLDFSSLGSGSSLGTGTSSSSFTTLNSSLNVTDPPGPKPNLPSALFGSNVDEISGASKRSRNSGSNLSNTGGGTKKTKK